MIMRRSSVTLARIPNTLTLTLTLTLNINLAPAYP